MLLAAVSCDPTTPPGAFLAVEPSACPHDNINPGLRAGASSSACRAVPEETLPKQLAVLLADAPAQAQGLHPEAFGWQ